MSLATGSEMWSIGVGRIRTPYGVRKRRTVESSELDGLFAEIAHYGASVGEDPERTMAKEQAETEQVKPINLGRPVLELDASPLRQALVDLYHPVTAVIGKATGELEYLDEYAHDAGKETEEGITA